MKQCLAGPLKVADLVSFLQQLPQDAPVYAWCITNRALGDPEINFIEAVDCDAFLEIAGLEE